MYIIDDQQCTLSTYNETLAESKSGKYFTTMIVYVQRYNMWYIHIVVDMDNQEYTIFTDNNARVAK